MNNVSLTRHFSLCLLGILTLLASAGTALAQQASTTAAAATTDTRKTDTLEEVVVTGFRGAAQRAQEIKRLAPSVVEAVTLEDLGKFTDSSVSDALARIPGLNVRHQLQPNGGTDGITLRGLSGSFVQSTINGRQVLGTAGFGGTSNSGRDLDYGVIPSEILGSITVYKTPTASMIESGLAGEIDVSTLRPLDFNPRDTKMFFGSLTASADRDKGYKKTGPKVSGIFGGKFLDNTLGVYLAGVDAKQYRFAPGFGSYGGVQDINVRNADGTITRLKNIGVTESYSPADARIVYENRSFSSGLQWKPSAHFELNADLTHNLQKTKFGGNFGDYYTFYAFDPSASTTVFEPGGYKIDGQQLTYYDTSKITRAGGALPFPAIPTSIVRSRTKELYGGLNLAWTGDGGSRVALDLSHGQNDVFISYSGPYGFQSAAGSDTTIDTANRTTPLITFANPAALENVNNYIGQAYYFWQEDYLVGDRNAVALDAMIPFTENLKLKAGARYDATKVKFVQFFGNNDQQGYGQFQYALDASEFSGTDRYSFEPINYPHLSVDAFCANNVALCSITNFGKGSAIGGFPDSPNGSPGDVLQYSPNDSYFVREAKTALYSQLDSVGTLFGLQYTGNFGVRAVRVNEKGQSYQGAVYRYGGGNNPIDHQTNLKATDTNAYWEVLPAFNLNLQPRTNIAVRFAIAKTMTLANYKQLAPQGSVNIFYPDPRTGYHDPNNFQGGNTRLKPTTAWNYDLTGEYYTASGGSVVGSLFYKDVRDLITTLSRVNTTLPGYGDTIFQSVTSPINADKGSTYGVELGFNQPFTFLPSPWDGLGAQANYYYVHSKVTTTLNGGATRTGAFPNVSKDNANATLYYEKYGWGARLSYNYRGTSLIYYGDFDQSVFARPESTLDTSLNKKIGDHFEIILTGSNINSGGNQEYYRKGISGTNFFSYGTRPVVYTLSLRGNL